MITSQAVDPDKTIMKKYILPAMLYPILWSLRLIVFILGR